MPDMDEDHNNAMLAIALADQIRPMLAHYPPDTQSAVLADLLATWLAGHFVAGDRQATDAMRSHLLGNHLKLVTRLIAVAEREMAARLAQRSN